MTEKMQHLDLPVPPMLEEALGYDGSSRWVAFYWTPFGDEFVYDDGVISADGSWHTWLTFKHHPRIVPHLEPYHLGNSTTVAKHWLLLDRQTRTLCVGEQKNIKQFLRQNAPLPPSLTPEEIDALTQSLSEAWATLQRMEREAKLAQDLENWLDKPGHET